jgi:hypothetical protein
MYAAANSTPEADMGSGSRKKTNVATIIATCASRGFPVKNSRFGDRKNPKGLLTMAMAPAKAHHT